MNSIKLFNTESFINALKAFYEELKVPVDYLADRPASPADVLGERYKATNEVHKLIEDVFALGMVNDAIFEGTETFKNLSQVKNLKADYDGLLLFGVTLKNRKDGLPITRSHLAEITRVFNRTFPYTPVTIIFKYDNLISFANSERIQYKQEWREGEKVGKVIILRDIHTETTHAGHERILLDLVKPVGVNNYDQLHQHWLQVLDVNILNKKFFQDLANWYFWAMENVSFPDDLEKKKDVRNATNLIRLITRVVFIWFIKEKSLVPNALFNKSHLDKILKDFNKNKKSQNYYNAILQNLFFGTLNQKMEERKFAKEGDIRTNKEEYGVKNLFRYADLFNIPEKEVLPLFKDVPFLNGGLFDCLDKPNDDGKIEYVDGFSRNAKKQASVPDYIFFGEEKEVDLNEVYGTKNKRYSSRGLINLLESYKFTVAENTPIEEEIALDPELLGKVFENLLASYNPEKQTTARKQTGSFYTPREIVNYMVDESLLEYIKQNVKNESKDFETRLRDVFSYSENPNPFSEAETKDLIEAINNCKILDPACGSGAFPMGILHKMVHILQKLDPENKLWKDLQRKKAIEETEAAFKIGDKEERARRLAEINDVFENNASDYGRKLYLIENCIYGIDIQPIAVQIAKLRFFISLVIDQKVNQTKENFGVRSLPNLETKFVAANTLIGLDIPTNDLFSENNPIKNLENELKNVRHEYFTASNRKDKLRLQKRDKELRKKIAFEISDTLINKKKVEIANLEKQLVEAKKKLIQIEGESEQKETISNTNLFGLIETKIVDKKKDKIKAQLSQIVSIEKQITLLEAMNSKGTIQKVAQQVSSFDPYDQNQSSGWFDPEWMFGLINGFDILIGNPPYGIVKSTNTEKHILAQYQAYYTADFKINLYALFLEKSIKLSKDGGVNSFIIPDSSLNLPAFKKLREYILKTAQLEFIAHYNEDVFESAAVGKSVILSYSKGTKGETFLFRSFKNSLEFEESIIDNSKVKKDNDLKFVYKSNESDADLLLDKLKSLKNKLSDYCDVYDGINPGSEEIKDTLITDRRIDSDSKKIIDGKCFYKYTPIDWDGSYIYYNPEYVEKLRRKIESKGGAFTARIIKKTNFFIQPKIITRQTADTIIGTIDISKYYVKNSVHSTLLKKEYSNSISLSYILGILNSKLIEWFYKTESLESGRLFPQVKIERLRNLPIIISKDKNIIKQIENIVGKTIESKSSNPDKDTHKLENQIDELVYKLYDLTGEEINIIEDNE
jgi:hypothetical protein